MPYKLPRNGLCEYMESPYWKLIEQSLYDASDIPKRNPDELYCVTFKKVTYFFGFKVSIDHFTIYDFRVDTGYVIFLIIRDKFRNF